MERPGAVRRQPVPARGLAVRKARRHFNFDTRDQVAPGRGSFDVSPRRVKAWVNSLPVANSGETARLLFAALTEVNGLRLNLSDRFRFLEAMRTPVARLCRSLERHYMGKPFPLADRDRQVAELGREFQALMAEGYKILLRDLGSRAVLALGIRRRIFSTAVHRAIRYLSHTLLKSYQLYAPYPDNVWRELHKLFRLAVWHGIQDWEVADEENRLVPETSIADAYKQILLLAISSPYRLRQGDVGRVYIALERWAPLCQLNPIDAWQQDRQGQFGVPADIDDQPKYLELNRETAAGVEWVLDTAALGRLLREQFSRLTSSETNEAGLQAANIPPDISPQLMGRVMQSWGMMLKRGYSRLEKDGEDAVEVALGLSAIHHFISEEFGLPEVLADGSGEETELTDEVPLPWVAGADRRVDHEAVRCRVKDEGPGGYRLEWSGESSAKAQVGSLLGIRRCDAIVRDGPWGIGAIRWMRAMQDNRMEMGVQMLAPAAEAVNIRACNAKGACGERVSGLLLAPVPAANAADSIVGPVFLSNFEMVMLQTGAVVRRAKFTRVLENTGIYARFEFEVLPRSEAERGELRRRQDDDSEEPGHESLWSSI